MKERLLMSTSINKLRSIPFLRGGGEMGKLIRSKDWSVTPVGDPETWPQSLRITLGILLSSKFPMFLWWGKELICFYNDAYRPSLGKNGKHPDILGQPAKQAWSEIWDIIGPLIDQVLSKGEATWSEDQLVPIYRNGHIEDVYWTFSYSPVYDESDEVAGVLVICSETTEKVMTLNKLEESKNQLEFAIEATELGTWDYNPLTDRISTNERLKKWFGLPPGEQIELHHALNSIADKDRQKVTEAIQKATEFSSGGNYDIEYSIVHPVTQKETIVHAKGRAWFNDVKIAYRFNGTLEDVTEQTIARKKIEQTLTELEFFKFIVDNVSDFVGVCDMNFIPFYVNKEGLRLVGLESLEQLKDTPVKDFFFPEDVEFILNEFFPKVLKEGKGETEIRFKHFKTGEAIWMIYNVLVVKDPNGKPAGLATVSKNITERKKTEENLKLISDRFRLLADSMPQHIWTSDNEGNLNYYNKSVFNYTGLTPEQLNKDGWFQIVHPDDREENMKQWILSIKTGKHFLFEHRFRRHDGEYRWQLSRAIPQMDNRGRIQLWVGTSTDIHDIKRNVQLKDDFIKMASHELKTPVTTINGYVQLLTNMYKDDTNPMLTGSLATINKHISKLTKLIADLLDVTKIESGSLHLTKADFNINELIEEIIEDIQMTTTTHKIIFNPDTETSIVADRDRISQVLINLLVNAIKYSRGAEQVIVTTRLLPNELIVSVQDFGIGIDPGDQDNIFERFYRVQGNYEKTFPGLGIGLFIVREIISNHHGRIWVESKKNKGSIFHFSLPLINAK
jgi:PAS domain S-box-containing protein